MTLKVTPAVWKSHTWENIPRTIYVFIHHVVYYFNRGVLFNCATAKVLWLPRRSWLHWLFMERQRREPISSSGSANLLSAKRVSTELWSVVAVLQDQRNTSRGLLYRGFYLPERFRANIANTLWAKWTAFTRSAITPPKLNRFGWNLEYCEPNVVGWPWRTLDASRAVVTVWEGDEILFFFCHANNARFRRILVRQILRHLNTTSSIGDAVKTFGTEFWNFTIRGRFFTCAAQAMLG